MTSTEFNLLTHIEKLEALETDNATHLEVSYITGPCKVALFELHGFYVSVWYNRQTDRIIKARAFSDLNKLDAFLANIDLLPIYSLLS